MPRRLASAFAALALLLFVPVAPATASIRASGPSYRPPVDAPLIDRFRPPDTPYGAGNRGVDYAAPPGTPVHAAGDGTVTFAGRVGGSLHVTVLHDDGVRTTVSFLATTEVHRGQRVQQGDLLGAAAAGPLHFGARVGDAYIDPLALMWRPAPRARLVPDDGKGLPSEAGERSAIERLLRTLGAGGRTTARAVAWAGGQAARVLDQDLLRLATLLAATPDRLAVGLALAAWTREQGGCTSRSRPTPSRLKAPRVAVLVGGLGSSTGHAAVLDVDTASLGYTQRVQFSYRPDSSPYTSIDTQADLHQAGERMRALLDRVAREHPHATIDVIAHSQGGLVARAALRTEHPAVEHLVTLGTPHSGAPLAGIAGRIRASPEPVTPVAAATAAVAKPGGLHPLGLAIDNLRPGSPFITGLPRPAGTKVTSIGARTDWVVPALRSWLPGAKNVVVSAPGVTAHDSLPGSPEAYREIALAVNDLPPTCQGAIDALFDAAAAVSIELGTSALGNIAHTG